MAAAALHRSPAMLLRLRHRHRLLLPDPARFISSRAESLLRLWSATANASSPPAAPPLPLSTGSTAPSMHTQCPPSPPSAPYIGSCDFLLSPRPTLSPRSILPQRLPDGLALLAAVEAGTGSPTLPTPSGLPHHPYQTGSKEGHGAIPVRGEGVNVMRIKAVSNQKRRQGFHSQCSQKRFMSAECKRSPVAHLLNLDEADVLKEEWVGPIKFLKEFSPLKDSRSNPLNLEIPGFADKPHLHFSETGATFFHCLIFLALINNNAGYCVKDSFTKDNILVCPNLKQVRFKTVQRTSLNPKSRDSNRASSYAAAADLMQELLEEVCGSDVMAHLSIEAMDLFNKLVVPSNERLIIYHPSLLSVVAWASLCERVYQLVFQIFPTLGLQVNQLKAAALEKMAYTYTKVTVEDIIRSHNLLDHIEKSKHCWQTAEEIEADPEVDLSRPKSRKDKHIRLGKKVVAIATHTIQYGLDSKSKMVLSIKSCEDHLKTMGSYTQEQVVDLVKTILPLHLLKVQETFAVEGLWSYLEMDHFWKRQLEWMGSVPEPTEGDLKEISIVSYGKRRINARKFGRPSQSGRHDRKHLKKADGC